MYCHLDPCDGVSRLSFYSDIGRAGYFRVLGAFFGFARAPRCREFDCHLFAVCPHPCFSSEFAQTLREIIMASVKHRFGKRMGVPGSMA